MLRRFLLLAALLPALLALGLTMAASPASAARFKAMAAGADHTCGLRDNGTVWCWGNGTSGQIGVIGAVRARTPIMVIGTYTAQQVSGGEGFWCELLSGGEVRCTGGGDAGQIGNGELVIAQFPQEVVGLPPASRVEAGDSTACAIAGGGVWCWGDGSRGQLGNGQLMVSGNPTPQAVPGLADIADLSVGYTHVCALRTDGQVFCWGDTAAGKLGNGLASGITVPGTPVTGITDARQVVTGRNHSCALRGDGTVSCWGGNDAGQLGNGTPPDPEAATNQPGPVNGLTGVTQLAAYNVTTCALKGDGTVWCWGAGQTGQLGNGARVSSNVPVQVSGLADAAQITVGQLHACAVTRSQVPYCWGSNRQAQLGSGGLIGTPGVEPTAQVVQDAVRGTAQFNATPLTAQAPTTTSGGYVYLRLLRVTRTRSACPTSVRITLRARGREATRTTSDVEKPQRGRYCIVTARVDLPRNTQKATSVTYLVRGTGLKTVKRTIRAVIP